MRERRQDGLAKIDLTGVRTTPKRPNPTAEEVASRARMPSREAEPQAEPREQCNMSLQASVNRRFKALADRLKMSKPELLNHMMDRLEHDK